jgi:hypothetical protein
VDELEHRFPLLVLGFERNARVPALTYFGRRTHLSSSPPLGASFAWDFDFNLDETPDANIF